MTDRQTLMLEKEKLACTDVFQLMGESQDAELGASLQEKLSLHVSSCNACAKFQKDYSEFQGLISEFKKEREYVQTAQDKQRLRSVLESRLGI
jgi:hypothetical protein